MLPFEFERLRFRVPCRDGCREPGPAIHAVVLALSGFHPHACALPLHDDQGHHLDWTFPAATTY